MEGLLEKGDVGIGKRLKGSCSKRCRCQVEKLLGCQPGENEAWSHILAQVGKLTCLWCLETSKDMSKHQDRDFLLEVAVILVIERWFNNWTPGTSTPAVCEASFKSSNKDSSEELHTIWTMEKSTNHRYMLSPHGCR